MRKLPFSYLSLSILVCVFYVYASDVDTSTLDIISVDTDTTQIILPPPQSDIGTVGYDAQTWKLLFTTSLDADDPEILKHITGAGEYIIVRTKDATWCTDLTLHECRRSADFIKETSLTIAPEPILVPVSDPWVETTLDILPTGEAVISYIDAFPEEVIVTESQTQEDTNITTQSNTDGTISVPWDDTVISESPAEDTETVEVSLPIENQSSIPQDENDILDAAPSLEVAEPTSPLTQENGGIIDAVLPAPEDEVVSDVPVEEDVPALGDLPPEDA
jgi:hypothetical protein